VHLGWCGVLGPWLVIAPPYDSFVPVDLDVIPQTRPLDHTMYEALDAYVAGKVPETDINQVLADGGGVYVLGVFPADAESVLAHYGFADLRPLRWDYAVTTKSWNWIRPTFYVGTVKKSRERVVVCCVVPGIDYLLHYASMLRHYVATRTVRPAVRAARFPTAEARIELWSGMPDDLIRAGDRVVLGYVDELAELLQVEPANPRMDSEHFGVARVDPGQGLPAVAFVGVAFSFWGSISREVAVRLCAQGASEIIYAAKLGALSSPDDLYERIFVPDEFTRLEGAAIRELVSPTPPNGLLALYPDMSSGGHVSIPTVLEEDYGQRSLAATLRAQSIDNEIAHMAGAVSQHNVRTNSTVRFTAIHFATDYLRAKEESMLRTTHDLAIDKADAREARSRILARIAIVLGPYLGL
jgi:hypothetical protein